MGNEPPAPITGSMLHNDLYNDDCVFPQHINQLSTTQPRQKFYVVGVVIRSKGYTRILLTD